MRDYRSILNKPQDSIINWRRKRCHSAVYFEGQPVWIELAEIVHLPSTLTKSPLTAIIYPSPKPSGKATDEISTNNSGL